MPRKPLRKKIQKRQLTGAEIAYLSDDDTGIEAKSWTEYDIWNLRHGFNPVFGNHEPAQLWAENKDDFLPEFISKHPGRRPCSWWQWDAPRQADQGSGCLYEGTLPEPRRRIGGKGELQGGYVPFYQYGIPQHWNSKTLDPNDPPRFESQAAYLQRHGFLTDAEKRILAKKPEAWEPEKIAIDEDED